MNTMEDRLRAALEETAEEISPHGVPPLRLNRARRLGLPGFGDRHRWAAWLAPLAAAAAVAIVIMAATAVSGTIGRGRQPPTATGTAGLPPYYVALRFSSQNRCCRADQPLVPKTRAVVVSTATGAVLTSIAPPGRHTTFVGVTGAADDGTFVLAVQQYGSTSPTRFYLLRITPLGPSPLRTVAPTGSPKPFRTIPPTGSPSPYIPTGSPSPYIQTGSPSQYATPTGSPSPFRTIRPTGSPTPSGSTGPFGSPTPSSSTGPFGSPSADGSSRPALLLAPLSPLHIPPDQAGLMGFALSPQGTSLAVLDTAGLHVVNLGTGTQRTWDRPTSCFSGSFIGGATTDAMLSWAADGRRLATVCSSRPIGAWLLDTTAPGSNLVKDSQLLVPGPALGRFGVPPWHRILLTSDARTVVGVLQVPDPHRPVAVSPIQELAEFSASTGKLLRVLNRMPVWNFVDFEQVLWASPSGHSLLVSDTVPYRGGRRAFFLLNDAGVLIGHQFTLLPHWSLDTLAAAW
jgi:hypothetical protein